MPGGDRTALDAERPQLPNVGIQTFGPERREREQPDQRDDSATQNVRHPAANTCPARPCHHVVVCRPPMRRQPLPSTPEARASHSMSAENVVTSGRNPPPGPKAELDEQGHDRQGPAYGHTNHRAGDRPATGRIGPSVADAAPARTSIHSRTAVKVSAASRNTVAPPSRAWPDDSENASIRMDADIRRHGVQPAEPQLGHDRESNPVQVDGERDELTEQHRGHRHREASPQSHRHGTPKFGRE